MGPPYQPGYSSPFKKLLGTPERKTAGIAPQARYFQNYQQQPAPVPSPYSPAPMGMQRMPAGVGQAAMPSAADRLLGDQYTYPSQASPQLSSLMQRAPGAMGQPGGMAEGQTLGRLLRTSAPQAPGNFATVGQEAFDSPYYQARRARNATGQGSPYIPGGQNMTAQQRQQGYAAMVPQQQPHPLDGLSYDEQLKMLDNLRQRASQPMMNSSQYAAANGYQATPSAPPPAMPSPLQRLMQGTATQQYSNSGRAQANILDNRQPMAGSREEIVARAGNFGRQMPGQLDAQGNTIHNADGRFYQGAQLVVPAGGGNSYFRDAPQQTFAGGADGEDQANANRMKGYAALEARGAGYYNPRVGAFVGNGAVIPAQNAQEGDKYLAGRLAAGGNTPTKLTPQQLGDNRAAMIQRMAGQREKAMARVQELAQMRTQDRRARANPSPLNRLLQNNPQAALAFQAQQMQQQHQMAMQNADNQGRLAIADREAQAAMERANIGGFVGALGANVPEDRAAAMFGRQLPPGMKQPGQVPKFAAGAFGGADKATYDAIKQFAETADNDDDVLAFMTEMGLPQELQAGMLERAKPNFWRKMRGGVKGEGTDKDWLFKAAKMYYGVPQ
jgi:hypothetical protein